MQNQLFGRDCKILRDFCVYKRTFWMIKNHRHFLRCVSVSSENARTLSSYSYQKTETGLVARKTGGGAWTVMCPNTTIVSGGGSDWNWERGPFWGSSATTGLPVGDSVSLFDRNSVGGALSNVCNIGELHLLLVDNIDEIWVRVLSVRVLALFFNGILDMSVVALSLSISYGLLYMFR